MRTKPTGYAPIATEDPDRIDEDLIKINTTGKISHLKSIDVNESVRKLSLVEEFFDLAKKQDGLLDAYESKKYDIINHHKLVKRKGNPIIPSFTEFAHEIIQKDTKKFKDLKKILAQVEKEELIDLSQIRSKNDSDKIIEDYRSSLTEGVQEEVRKAIVDAAKEKLIQAIISNNPKKIDKEIQRINLFSKKEEKQEMLSAVIKDVRLKAFVKQDLDTRGQDLVKIFNRLHIKDNQKTLYSNLVSEGLQDLQHPIWRCLEEVSNVGEGINVNGLSTTGQLVIAFVANKEQSLELLEKHSQDIRKLPLKQANIVCNFLVKQALSDISMNLDKHGQSSVDKYRQLCRILANIPGQEQNWEQYNQKVRRDIFHDATNRTGASDKNKLALLNKYLQLYGNEITPEKLAQEAVYKTIIAKPAFEQYCEIQKQVMQAIRDSAPAQLAENLDKIKFVAPKGFEGNVGSFNQAVEQCKYEQVIQKNAHFYDHKPNFVEYLKGSIIESDEYKDTQEIKRYLQYIVQSPELSKVLFVDPKIIQVISSNIEVFDKNPEVLINNPVLQRIYIDEHVAGNAFLDHEKCLKQVKAIKNSASPEQLLPVLKSAALAGNEKLFESISKEVKFPEKNLTEYREILQSAKQMLGTAKETNEITLKAKTIDSNAPIKDIAKMINDPNVDRSLVKDYINTLDPRKQEELAAAVMMDRLGGGRLGNPANFISRILDVCEANQNGKASEQKLLSPDLQGIFPADINRRFGFNFYGAMLRQIPESGEMSPNQKLFCKTMLEAAGGGKERRRSGSIDLPGLEKQLAGLTKGQRKVFSTVAMEVAKPEPKRHLTFKERARAMLSKFMSSKLATAQENSEREYTPDNTPTVKKDNSLFR